MRLLTTAALLIVLSISASAMPKPFPQDSNSSNNPGDCNSIGDFSANDISTAQDYCSNWGAMANPSVSQGDGWFKCDCSTQGQVPADPQSGDSSVGDAGVGSNGQEGADGGDGSSDVSGS